MNLPLADWMSPPVPRTRRDGKQITDVDPVRNGGGQAYIAAAVGAARYVYVGQWAFRKSNPPGDVRLSAPTTKSVSLRPSWLMPTVSPV